MAYLSDRLSDVLREIIYYYLYGVCSVRAGRMHVAVNQFFFYEFKRRKFFPNIPLVHEKRFLFFFSVHFKHISQPTYYYYHYYY